MTSRVLGTVERSGSSVHTFLRVLPARASEQVLREPLAARTTLRRVSRRPIEPFGLESAAGASDRDVDGAPDEYEDDFFRTMGYIAVQHVAPRIQGEVLMATALMDTMCPPSTQFAAFNKIRAPKRMAIDPDYGHEALPG